METVEKDKVLNRKVWLSSLKITLNTLVCCLVVCFYLLSVMFFITPSTNAKIFKFLGFSKAEESCYVQIYKKSDSSADLYNLVLLEAELNNQKKELLYINELFLKEDYQTFCKKLNNASIISARDNKSLIAVVGDVDSYLASRKVKCLYNINKDLEFNNRSKSVQQYVRSQLNKESYTELSFYTYVMQVVNDDTLTQEQKKQEFESFKNLISTDNDIETSTLLINRESDLLNLESVYDSVENKIIIANALVKYYSASYLYNEILEESSEILNVIKTNYDNAVDKYLILVN